ncbi:MAG: extensin family protein [Marinicella pacifica]
MNKTLKVIIIGFIIGTLAVLLSRLVVAYLPDNVNPLKPLRIEHAPSFVLKTKINHLKNNPDACFAVLESSDLTFERVADETTGDNCAFRNVVRLIQSDISYGGDIILKCPALVALAIWERHDLQPLAIETFGQKIIRIRHYGTYACRNINNAKQGRRSQHAYANAIDIAGFVMADGSEISVLVDWGQATQKGQFLKTVHQLACDKFTTVLGPDYNNAHHNHFHFDQGGWSLCR